MPEKRRGRPRKTSESREYQIHLRLRVGEDDEIITFLDKVPPGARARAVIRAMRNGGLQSQSTLPEDPGVDQLLNDLADSLLE